VEGVKREEAQKSILSLLQKLRGSGMPEEYILKLDGDCHYEINLTCTNIESVLNYADGSFSGSSKAMSFHSLGSMIEQTSIKEVHLFKTAIQDYSSRLYPENLPAYEMLVPSKPESMLRQTLQNNLENHLIFNPRHYHNYRPAIDDRLSDTDIANSFDCPENISSSLEHSFGHAWNT
jgi:hypothetical protein